MDELKPQALVGLILPDDPAEASRDIVQSWYAAKSARHRVLFTNNATSDDQGNLILHYQKIVEYPRRFGKPSEPETLSVLRAGLSDLQEHSEMTNLFLAKGYIFKDHLTHATATVMGIGRGTFTSVGEKQMAEETGKAAETSKVASDALGRLEATKSIEEMARAIREFEFHLNSIRLGEAERDAWLTAITNPVRHLYLTSLPLPLLYAQSSKNAANTAELALAAGGGIEDVAGDDEAQRREAVDEAVTKALINSAIADVERTREDMQRDEEDIQQLKQETRLILTKLAA